jgi:hypothetical protein
LEWTLLCLDDDAATVQAAAAFGEAARALGAEMKTVSLPRADLSALYGAPLALIRPDHIVAWRGTPGSDAQAIMRTVLGWNI